MEKDHQPSKRAQRTLEGQPGCPMFQGIPVAFSDNRFASELAPRSFHHLASWCARRGIKLTGANGQRPMWLRPSASSLGLRNNYIIHQLWYIWMISSMIYAAGIWWTLLDILFPICPSLHEYWWSKARLQCKVTWSGNTDSTSLIVEWVFHFTKFDIQICAQQFRSHCPSKWFHQATNKTEMVLDIIWIGNSWNMFQDNCCNRMSTKAWLGLLGCIVVNICNDRTPKVIIRQATSSTWFIHWREPCSWYIDENAWCRTQSCKVEQKFQYICLLQDFNMQIKLIKTNEHILMSVGNYIGSYKCRHNRSTITCHGCFTLYPTWLAVKHENCLWQIKIQVCSPIPSTHSLRHPARRSRNACGRWAPRWGHQAWPFWSQPGGLWPGLAERQMIGVMGRLALYI